MSKASSESTETAASVLSSVFEGTIYLKGTLHYMDLPCVSTVCLLLIFEFRVIGMGFLNLVVSISFLTYDRYDSCFRTNTQVTTSSQ